MIQYGRGLWLRRDDLLGLPAAIVSHSLPLFLYVLPNVEAAAFAWLLAFVPPLERTLDVDVTKSSVCSSFGVMFELNSDVEIAMLSVLSW